MMTHGNDYALLRKLKLLEEHDAQVDRMDRLAVLRDSIRSKVKEAYERNKTSYNLRSRKRELEVGQMVIHRNFPQSSLPEHYNAKLAPRGVKATVVRKIGYHCYELRDVDSNKIGVYHLKDIWT